MIAHGSLFLCSGRSVSQPHGGARPGARGGVL